MRYIALLRGINVSGQKKVPMSELTAVFQKLKFETVATYIQSGNVVFTAPETNATRLVAQIEAAVLKTFSFEVRVVLRTAAQWQKLIKSNPYLKQDRLEVKTLYAALLRDAVDPKKNIELQPYCQSGETAYLKGEDLYLTYPQGAGKSKLNLSVIERKLGTIATVRNWNTVQALAGLL